LLKIVCRKTIIISNRNYEIFEFEYAVSIHCVQINLKTLKHPVLTFVLAKIGTSF
jgi:hypothetical protein